MSESEQKHVEQLNTRLMRDMECSACNLGEPDIALRDWFAGMALSACRPGDWGDSSECAAWAYHKADAMMAERSKIRKL